MKYQLSHDSLSIVKIGAQMQSYVSIMSEISIHNYIDLFYFQIGTVIFDKILSYLGFRPF